MKQAKRIVLLLTSLLFLMGAYQAAPVAPSKNYYVNDYANTIFREHREKISQLSDQLIADTEQEAVVLVVPDLGGADPDDYARSVLDGWHIGGTGGNGVLLLYAAEEQEYRILPGAGLSALFDEETVSRILQERIAPYHRASNHSAAMLSGYKGILYELYLYNGLEPDAELYPEERPQSTSFSATPVMVVVVALLALLISMRLSRRYREKYLHRHQPRRKDFTAKHPEYDDMPENRRARPDEPVRREGFIIYREDQQPPEGEDEDKD